MDSRLLALKLFLAELGIPSVIETLDDRKRVQKAVYLGQLSGVDLGYRFGWYVHGPYSPELTRDYYSLAEALEAGEDSVRDKVLHPSVRSRLSQLSPIMVAPAEFRLGQEKWLELVASYHYLRAVRKLAHDETLQQLRLKKPALAPYTNVAVSALQSENLLPS